MWFTVQRWRTERRWSRMPTCRRTCSRMQSTARRKRSRSTTSRRTLPRTSRRSSTRSTTRRGTASLAATLAATSRTRRSTSSTSTSAKSPFCCSNPAEPFGRVARSLTCGYVTAVLRLFLVRLYFCRKTILRAVNCSRNVSVWFPCTSHSCCAST